MTDRRRNLFVLLLVAGLLLASAVLIWQKPTRLGLDLKGGVSLIYQAKPTKQSQITGEAIDRSIDVMRKRVDQLGVAEPEIQRSGPDQIDVSLPDVKNADEARSEVGTTAQMWFYDWEGSVLGKHCKTHPQDAQVTGGQKAGSDATALSQYDAVTRAASCPRTDSGKESSGNKLYLVDKKAKKVLAGPEESRDRPAPRRADQADPVRRRPARYRAAGRRARARRAARPRRQAARPVVRAQGPAGPQRHEDQEPRAELRQRARR